MSSRSKVNQIVRKAARVAPPGLRRLARRLLPETLRARLLGTPPQAVKPAAKAVAAPAVRRRAPGEKPVLGLAGFFGHGNYGDELFLQVFEQYFGDEFELRPISDVVGKPHFSRPIKEIIADVDAVLLGGGDILQPWNADPRYFNRKFLDKPVFVVGIGVPQYANGKPPSESVMASHHRFLHHPNVKHIGVRDEQAAEWIRTNIAPPLPVLVAPDIVTTLNLPDAPKPEGAPILGVVTRFRPNLDDPDDYTKIAEVAEKVMAEGWRVRHLILGTGIVGERDSRNADDLDVPGKEVFRSEDLDEITRAIGECTAFASMKFHGTVVATMYGVPSVVMIPTNKNVNFMRRLGLGALLSRFDDPELGRKFEERPTPDPAKLASTRAEADAHLRNLVELVRSEVAQDV